MELIFNFMIGVFLIVFLVASTQFETLEISRDLVGAKGFPQMVIIIALGLLVIITIKNIRELKKGKKKSIDFKDKGFLIMVRNIAILALYIFTMNYIGFIIGTFVFILLAIWNMGYREKTKGLIFSLVLTLGVTLIFGRVFYVALPRGIGLIRELSYFVY